MDKNPITKIVDWYNEAKKTEINDPDAITLATVDDTGFPNIRTVLLRKIDSDSFVFFTNYNSQKGNEIENNNNVAFSFHWKSLAKQIRIRGIAEKENGIVADDLKEGEDIIEPLSERILGRTLLDDFIENGKVLIKGIEIESQRVNLLEKLNNISP